MNVSQSLQKSKIFFDLVFVSVILFLVRSNLFLDAGAFSINNLFISLICMIAWFLVGRSMGLYEDYRNTQFAIEWIAFLKTILLYSLIVSCLFYFVLSQVAFGRAHLFIHFATLFFLIPVQKISIRLFYKRFRVADRVIRKVLIVGAGSNGKEFYSKFVKSKRYGYELTGFIGEEEDIELNGHYLGKTSDLDSVLLTHELDDIIVTIPIKDETVLEKIVTSGESQGKMIRVIPDFHRFGSRRLQVNQIGTLPIISLRSLPLEKYDFKLLKRGFDIVFSFLVIVLVFSWVFPIIAILIKLESKGPVFFIQDRWGLNNSLIRCFKFRTMSVSSKDIDENGNYLQARKNDPRITKVGAFLRKTNLDELPQFLNVLLGSMSVVGPRPHPVPLNIQSKKLVDNYLLRHWVKPGITGWAQVNGYRGETAKPYLMQKRVEFDVWYVENWTFWLDQQIILQTLVNMVKGEKNAY
ncbi:undecaprenyl-phosphate glucose phosphotransferase [Flavihumibacter sp. UBA7668]|uniref:undecaprenyl-phosphate glucose phosphotransferase n=1 Tax=Flavihumibacter sp. UBA7668 TaxID=1946542 RepID=UPI0025B98A08|nr:undecaprenyl-phosphate glucose phosphotransferase [Flavihumibacter sp. UBA7668]